MSVKKDSQSDFDSPLVCCIYACSSTVIRHCKVVYLPPHNLDEMYGKLSSPA